MGHGGAAGGGTGDEAGRLMMVLRPSMATLLAAGYANLQARQLLIAQTARPMGEEAVVAATKGLATAFSVGSVAEFFLSPYFGRFSDRYGRKPLLLAFLVGPACMRALCVLVKEPMARIRLLQLDFVSARVIGVQPTIAAAGTMISDVVPVAGQPGARSQITAAMALGQIIGNYASGWWNARKGPESTYTVTAVIPAVLFALLSRGLSETHPEYRPGADAAPVEAPQKAAQAPAAGGAIRTLLRDPECCLLAATLGLYEFMQYPGLSTVSILFMQDRLGWGPLQAGQFSSAIGLATFLGSTLAGWLIHKLGSVRHVTFAHCCTSVAYLLWGNAAGARDMAACLVPLALGTGASPVLMTRFVARAADLGTGRGEAAAVVQALGAAARAIAPQVFIWMYLRAKQGGGKGGRGAGLSLGSPMLLLSALALVQEVLHQALLRLRPRQ